MNREERKRIAVGTDDGKADNSLVVWLRLQKTLAEKNGIALTTLSRDSAVVGRIENDNSICQAMRVSPDHSHLCQSDCASAYNNAIAAGEMIEYRCHAGLHCFAAPVDVNAKQLVVLGGRAFTSASEYVQFLRRYDDLDGVRSGNSLKSVKFMSPRELRHAADLTASTSRCHFEIAGKGEPPSTSPDMDPSSPELLDAHLEIIRLSDQLESKKKALTQCYDFLHSLAKSLDSQKVYQSVLSSFAEIMQSERGSLMLLNQQSNELALEAAVGPLPACGGPIRVKFGEGIAGAVLASGAPMLVRDLDSDERISRPSRREYKTRSFISFPIALGGRKVGVINLTDRKGGDPYENSDLSLLELMAAPLALIIDRTEWHQKAETYQRMSLTDPLTGLPNRRYLEGRLFEEVERSKRHSTSLSFMLIDVDRFKHYNDIYGHTSADRVLINTAHILRRLIRTIDMAARFAGDEFCIVLPETAPADAARIAERLRAAVGRAEYFSEQGEVMGQVTISIGVSSFNSSCQSPLAIIESADRALYQAKTLGRNCVAVCEEAVKSEK